jgi:hypothetical protein
MAAKKPTTWFIPKCDKPFMPSWASLTKLTTRPQSREHFMRLIDDAGERDMQILSCYPQKCFITGYWEVNECGFAVADCDDIALAPDDWAKYITVISGKLDKLCLTSAAFDEYGIPFIATEY